ncbi:hypothetical protein WR25_22918 isoform C [Diploscapter pachys]|uniref:Long-chain-fatty-acid--CoA ligase n=2 Tax=Diploscapter pachys TaxID=2018661 RepID=A0A2A2L309_9BILA|nr:hypothetical protein WR25_22918 isoform C [Diploscapter pachys]
MPPSVRSSEGIGDENANLPDQRTMAEQAQRYFLRFSPTETVMLLTLVLALLPSNPGIGSVLLALISGYIYKDYGDFIYRSYLTLHRDLSGLYLIIIIKTHLWLALRRNRPLHEIFLGVVEKNLNKIAMIDIETSRTLTFKEFNQHCNRYANYFQNKNYRKGDVVALYMENSVEFVAAWMGLAKLGCVTSWINSNLKREQLSHCIETSKAKAIITSETLQNVLLDAISEELLKLSNVDVLVLGNPASGTEFHNFRKSLEDQDILEPKTKDDTDFRSHSNYCLTF